MNNILKSFCLAILILAITLKTTSGANDHTDKTESNLNFASIKNIKKEIILDLLDKLRADSIENSFLIHLVKKTGQKITYKLRKTKTKPKFRIFNINTLLNPAGLWEYNKI